MYRLKEVQDPAVRVTVRPGRCPPGRRVGHTGRVTNWAITVDCKDPDLLGRFWAEALGYVAAPAPTGYPDWETWFDRFEVPPDERGLTGAMVDPSGRGPALSFLVVPESKTIKNRLHLDLKVGGGRHVDWDVRWPRVLAASSD